MSSVNYSEQMPPLEEEGWKRYFLVFAQAHEEFRIPELQALAAYHGIEVRWQGEPDVTRPFMVVWLRGDEEARKLGSRGILIRSVWEYWADGRSYAEVHELNKAASSNWARYQPPQNSWRATISAYNHTIPKPRIVQVIDSFSYMAFEGPVVLGPSAPSSNTGRNKKRQQEAESASLPDVEWGVFEEYKWSGLQAMRAEMEAARASAGPELDAREEQNCSSVKEAVEPTRNVDLKGKSKALANAIVPEGPSMDLNDDGESSPRFRRIWLGRKICDSARYLVEDFNLKKRAYIGNTSMDAELSLLMANQALVNIHGLSMTAQTLYRHESGRGLVAGPGKLIYDPFAGTGSMLYACAKTGAMVFGSDIDGRTMRGKDGGKDSGIRASARQYGLTARILNCLVFDVTHHPWRTGGFVDAIVTDPPYGVRAGAKRLGKKDPSKHREEAVVLDDGTLAHVKQDYVPPTRPYHLSQLIPDLLDYALYLLRPGGRLVFWLPTISEDNEVFEAPVKDGLRIVNQSLQDFGKWGRRLITMEKTVHTWSQINCLPPSVPLPGDADLPGEFRTRYFAPSRKPDDTSSNGTRRSDSVAPASVASAAEGASA